MSKFVLTILLAALALIVVSLVFGALNIAAGGCAVVAIAFLHAAEMERRAANAMEGGAVPA